MAPIVGSHAAAHSPPAQHNVMLVVIECGQLACCGMLRPEQLYLCLGSGPSGRSQPAAHAHVCREVLHGDMLIEGRAAEP